jgi:hypothetical protein
MQAWEDIEPSPWLAQSFSYKLSDLQKDPKPAKRGWSRWVAGTAAAGLMTAALAFFIVMQYQPAPEYSENYYAPKAEISVPVKPASLPQVMAKPMVQENAHASTARVVAQVSPTRTASRVSRSHRRSPVRSAYAPRHRYTYRMSELVASRHADALSQSPAIASRMAAIDREKKDQESAREFLLREVFNRPKESPTTVVACNIGDAGISVEESLERVRGALRKAADVIEENAVNSPRSNAVSYEGRDL